MKASGIYYKKLTRFKTETRQKKRGDSHPASFPEQEIYRKPRKLLCVSNDLLWLSSNKDCHKNWHKNCDYFHVDNAPEVLINQNKNASNQIANDAVYGKYFFDWPLFISHFVMMLFRSNYNFFTYMFNQVLSDNFCILNCIMIRLKSSKIDFINDYSSAKVAVHS